MFSHTHTPQTLKKKDRHAIWDRHFTQGCTVLLQKPADTSRREWIVVGGDIASGCLLVIVAATYSRQIAKCKAKEQAAKSIVLQKV